MIIHALIVVMKGTTIYNAIRHDEKFTSSMPFSLKKNKKKEADSTHSLKSLFLPNSMKYVVLQIDSLQNDLFVHADD